MTRAQERKVEIFCRNDVERRTRRIGDDVKRGAMRPARRKADALRSCLAGRFHALWLSLPEGLKARPRVSAGGRPDRLEQRWIAISENLSEVAKLNIPARVSLRAKPKGPPPASGRRQYRPISSFDWIDQARQRLIGFGLTPFVDFHPSQHLLQWSARGRGRSAVYKTLLDKLPELGPDHVFIQLDVKSFYQHISHAWLEENLPLPKDVIRAQVHTGGMTFLPTRKVVTARLGLSERGAFEAFARQGIPMGSALASLVGEYVMSEALKELADRQEVPKAYVHSSNLHTYSDNLGVFMEGARLAAVVDLYQKAFASSAAGPFTLTCSPPKPAAGPFKFLGYWFRKRDGRAEAYVPQDIADQKINAITEDILTASADEIARVRERIRGVANEWAYWDGVDEWRRQAMAIILSAEHALFEFDAAQQSQIEPMSLPCPTSNGPARNHRTSLR